MSSNTGHLVKVTHHGTKSNYRTKTEGLRERIFSTGPGRRNFAVIERVNPQTPLPTHGVIKALISLVLAHSGKGTFKNPTWLMSESCEYPGWYYLSLAATFENSRIVQMLEDPEGAPVLVPAEFHVLDMGVPQLVEQLERRGNDHEPASEQEVARLAQTFSG